MATKLVEKSIAPAAAPAAPAREKKRLATKAKSAKTAKTAAAVALSTAQMNVRMDTTLHAQGNAALAEIGVTPSEAVRALWEKAAKRGEDLEEIRKLLFAPSRSKEEERKRALALVEEGHNIVANYYRSVGIDPEKLEQDTRTYEELRDEMYDEMLAEMEAWNA